MAVQCVLVGKGKDDVFTAVYGETTFDKVLKAYNENKIVQVVYQNRVYYLDSTTVISSPEVFNFISTFSNQNDEDGEIKHYAISLMTEDSWSGPFLQKSTPATHANTHAKNGTDPLSPTDIGAMELSENVLKQSNEDITSQVAQALSGDLVPFSGGTMTGLLNVLTPIGDSNATTKKYVDDALKKKIEMDSIGDLHVWKKTVVNTAAKDAYISLGPTIELDSPIIYLGNGDKNSAYFTYEPNQLVIYPSGALDNGTDAYKNYQYYWYSTKFMPGSSPSQSIQLAPSEMPGHYILFHALDTYYNAKTGIERDAWYYIPSDATITVTTSAQTKYNSGVQISKLQKVIGNPAVEAGTTTTYPVSTNPNAYQEGDDAKAAGYVVGEVVKSTGTYGFFGMMGFAYGTSYFQKISDAIEVADDGSISHVDPVDNISDSAVLSGASTLKEKIAGKYITLSENSYTKQPYTNELPPTGVVLYIPADVNVKMIHPEGSSLSNQYALFFDRYQPVTGYAAIPAGTTIEYLDKLGNKSIVQVVSYVGTGTYGENNACSITADFKIKVAIMLGVFYERGFISYLSNDYSRPIIIANELSTEYQMYYGFMTGGSSTSTSSNYGKISADKKTISWYHANATYQCNESGTKYYILLLG